MRHTRYIDLLSTARAALAPSGSSKDVAAVECRLIILLSSFPSLSLLLKPWNCPDDRGKIPSGHGKFPENQKNTSFEEVATFHVLAMEFDNMSQTGQLTTGKLKYQK